MASPDPQSSPDESQTLDAVAQASQHQLYDKFFKKMMLSTTTAYDFFQQHLPEPIQQDIDLEQLKLTHHSFIDTHYQHKEVDVLYQAKWRERPLYLYLLCEHQTQPNRWLPLRIFSYLARIWEFHRRRNPDHPRLPLIYPMLFYPGKQPWPYSLDLRSLIEAPEKLLDTYFLQPVQLIHAQPACEAELNEHPWSSTFSSAMYYATANCPLQELEPIFPTLNHFIQSGKWTFVRDVLNFIIVKGGSDPVEYQHLIAKHFDTDLEEEVMTLAQRFEQRGIEQGMQQGIQQGKQTYALLIVKQMLKKGFPRETIAELTGLSPEEILQMQVKSFDDTHEAF